jgi:hypothetical protein
MSIEKIVTDKDKKYNLYANNIECEGVQADTYLRSPTITGTRVILANAIDNYNDEILTNAATSPYLNNSNATGVGNFRSVRITRGTGPTGKFTEYNFQFEVGLAGLINNFSIDFKSKYTYGGIQIAKATIWNSNAAATADGTAGYITVGSPADPANDARLTIKSNSSGPISCICQIQLFVTETDTPDSI